MVFCHTKKDEKKKKEKGKRFFIQFSLHRTIKSDIKKYIYNFTVRKKAVISKDIKAECKSNLIKKKRVEKEEKLVFIYTLKKLRI